jgi:hypothetical protein
MCVQREARTSFAATPSSANFARCSRNAPCSASTPIISSVRWNVWKKCGWVCRGPKLHSPALPPPSTHSEGVVQLLWVRCRLLLLGLLLLLLLGLLLLRSEGVDR